MDYVLDQVCMRALLSGVFTGKTWVPELAIEREGPLLIGDHSWFLGSTLPLLPTTGQHVLMERGRAASSTLVVPTLVLLLDAVKSSLYQKS